MAKRHRREVMCSGCMKIFKTHSSKRFQCLKCDPLNRSRYQEEGVTFKIADGHWCCKRKDAPPFLEGGAVPVIVSRDEKIRVIENAPVTRTRFKQHYSKHVRKHGVIRHNERRSHESKRA